MRNTTDDMEELTHTVGKHLLRRGSRIIIVAPNLELARDTWKQLVESFTPQFEKVDVTGHKATVEGGGVLKCDTLEHPKNFLGPEWNLVVVVLTPALAAVFDSLDNLALAMRRCSGDNPPEQIQYLLR